MNGKAPLEPQGKLCEVCGCGADLPVRRVWFCLGHYVWVHQLMDAAKQPQPGGRRVLRAPRLDELDEQYPAPDYASITGEDLP
jgi:hypothetical protein